MNNIKNEIKLGVKAGLSDFVKNIFRPAHNLGVAFGFKKEKSFSDKLEEQRQNTGPR